MFHIRGISFSIPLLVLSLVGSGEGEEVAEFGVGHARQPFFAGAYREVGKFLLLLYHVVDAFLECVARYEAVLLFLSEGEAPEALFKLRFYFEAEV